MHLCVISRVSYNAARDVIFDNSAHYTERKLAKRSGGTRTIHEPSPHLKSLQAAIYRNCLSPVPVSPIAFAFEKGRNVASAARQHIGARSMIQLDVSNFYGSIGSQKVYSTFVAMGYPELLALETSLICSVEHRVVLRGPAEDGYVYEPLDWGVLPQGSSTSGKLSNLVCRDLDKVLQDVALREGASVTRYADDISFSMPRPMSRKKSERLLLELRQVLLSFDFAPNNKKTRVIPSAKEFKMLGLQIGQNKVWLDRRYKARIQGHLHGLRKFGLRDHSSSRGFGSDFEFCAHIWGHYAYCFDVDPDFAASLRVALIDAGVPRI
ncbi:reverse transcriptase family protein [Tersicoccus sp. MR15.9]|uniref:reverse transcriptase family protein n=1 Tax=Tersicoccus mangrovi TaxID=3121635 RepID=UPI002FE5896D